MDSFQARRVVRGVAVLLFLSSPACGGSGAMSQSSLSNADSDLSSSGLAPLAVGARVRPEIRSETSGTQTPPLRLQSANPEVLRVDGAALVGVSPGVAAVLATTEDGTVFDFHHVWVTEPDRIELSLVGAEASAIDTPFELVTGDGFSVGARMFEGSTELSGDFDVEWSSSSPEAVACLRDGRRNTRRIVARGPGTSTITVRAGQFVEELQVEVIP